MSLLTFIFGKSKYEEAREMAERFYLSNKITKEEYLELLKEIDTEEELSRW